MGLRGLAHPSEPVGCSRVKGGSFWTKSEGVTAWASWGLFIKTNLFPKPSLSACPLPGWPRQERLRKLIIITKTSVFGNKAWPSWNKRGLSLEKATAYLQTPSGLPPPRGTASSHHFQETGSWNPDLAEKNHRQSPQHLDPCSHCSPPSHRQADAPCRSLRGDELHWLPHQSLYRKGFSHPPTPAQEAERSALEGQAR